MTSTQTKISDIKHKLDQSHDTDPDYLSPAIKELRGYIFQVHASYETSLELIVYRDYLKSSESFWSFGGLFERMTFYDKQKLVHKIHNDFPNGMTTKLNELRNKFAHTKGQTLRNEYNQESNRLMAYELLEQAHDSLNAFWSKHQKA